MAKEIYKTIRDFPNYKVSNFGNVKSFNKNGIGCNVGKEGRILKPQFQDKTKKTSYVAVTLCRDGKQKQIQIHRLVATAFLPNPENKPQVNHIDGQRENNHVDNLEWCTGSENQCHAIYTGLWKSKITFEIAEQIRKEYAVGNVTQYVLAEKYKIGLVQINFLINNHTWKKEDYKCISRPKNLREK